MIDRETVLQHYRRGNDYSEIAKAVDCSERQIGRIVRDGKCEIDDLSRQFFRDGIPEAFWLVLINSGWPVGAIAKYYGFTAQNVYERINNFLSVR